MKIYKLLLFTLVLVANCFASDVTSNNSGVDILLMDPYLSTKYQRGVYLLYDCIDKHWVCTGRAESVICSEGRVIATENKYDSMPCSPIKEFDSESKCNEIQMRLTNSATMVRACKSAEDRKVDIIF